MGVGERAGTTHEALRSGAKLIATLKALLVNPGFLTNECLAGRRARWVEPIGLFLICSVAYFLAGPLAARINGAPTVSGGKVPFPLEAQAALEQIGARERLGDERFSRMTADGGALIVYVARTVNEAVPRLMFVLMPGFALLTWLAWRNSMPHYREHLWFSLHLHSAWFASMTVAALAQIAGVVAIEVLAGLGVLIYCTWYSAVAMQRVLGGTGGQMFVRTAIVGIVYGFWLVAALFALTAYALLTY